MYAILVLHRIISFSVVGINKYSGNVRCFDEVAIGCRRYGSSQFPHHALVLVHVWWL